MEPDKWVRDETPLSFYNPLTKPLTVYARDENNDLETHNLDPMKMYTYPTYVARHLIKNIKDAYVSEHDINPVTELDKMTALEKEIYGT